MRRDKLWKLIIKKFFLKALKEYGMDLQQL